MRRLSALPTSIVGLTSAVLLAPTAASAALYRLGPRLGIGPASLTTSDGLGYPGVDTAVPASPQAPNGVIHTSHFGADTAIWNTSVEGHMAAMPRAGQADVVKLEGCAEHAAGGPVPLTDIHFQTLRPQRGGFRVELSTGAFTIPVCGEGGASESTVSSYAPVNLCVERGDYLAFNDEGGFVEPYYRAGVPYHVLAPVHGSSIDSFIRGSGTNNGDLFNPSDRGAMDGFSSRGGVQLMLQVELGTGPDARYVCPGGIKDKPPVLPPLRVSRQTDGINRKRVVAVAIYCRPPRGCHGGARLSLLGSGTVGHRSFSLPGNATSHLPIRVTPGVLRAIRRDGRVTTRIRLQMAHETFTQRITIKIL